VLVLEPLQLGVDVDVDVALVFAANASDRSESQSEPLRLPARTAWCTPVDSEYQLGLSFRGLDANAARYLQMFLKYLSTEKIESLTSDSSDDIFGEARRRAGA
jgi:hypothetical protein